MLPTSGLSLEVSLLTLVVFTLISVSRIVDDDVAAEEVLGIWRAGELLAEQAGHEQQRAAWPVVRCDVLGLPGGVSGDQADTANGLAADPGGVVLDERVVA